MGPILPEYTIDRQTLFVARNANENGPRQSTVDRLKIIAKIVKKDLHPENYGNVQCEDFLAFREQLVTDAHNISEDWHIRRERSSRVRKCWLTLTRKQAKINKLIENINRYSPDAIGREAERRYYTRSPGERDLEDELHYLSEFRIAVLRNLLPHQEYYKPYIVKTGFLRRDVDFNKSFIKILEAKEANDTVAEQLLFNIRWWTSPPKHMNQRLAQSIERCDYKGFSEAVKENVISGHRPVSEAGHRPLLDVIMDKIHEVKNNTKEENRETLTQHLFGMLDIAAKTFVIHDVRWFKKAIEYGLSDCAKALLPEEPFSCDIVDLAFDVARSPECDPEFIDVLLSSLSYVTEYEPKATLRSILATVVHCAKCLIDQDPLPAESEDKFAKLLTCINLIANKERELHGEKLDFSTDCRYINERFPFVGDNNHYVGDNNHYRNGNSSVAEIASGNDRILDALDKKCNVKSANKT